MEGRRTPRGSASPLRNHATTNPAPVLQSKSTPTRPVSPFYNRTPSAAVSSVNHNTPKRSASPMHQTPRGSISPLHSRTPKGSASPVYNQTSKRSISPYLAQRPKGSISPLHSQTTTSSVSPLHTLIPKRSPSPLPFQTSTNSGSMLPIVTPKCSVSPFLGKSPKFSVSSQYSRNPKGSVSPLHDKVSERLVSPSIDKSCKGSVSPLPNLTPKRSVSPFQHRTPNRSVSPFQHQTPKGPVSTLQSQISEYSVSSLPSRSQEKDPSDLVSPQNVEEKIPKSSTSPQHDEKKSHEGSASPLRTKEKPSPNYLKASSGTCHDLCKYGARDELEEDKGKHAVLKSLKKGKYNGERRKKTVIKLRSLSSGKIVFSEKFQIIVEDASCSNEEASNPVEWQDIESYDDASVLSTQNEGESMNSNNSDGDRNLVEKRNKKQVQISEEYTEKDASDKKEPALKKKKDSKKPDSNPTLMDIKSYDDASDPSTEPQNGGESMNSNNCDGDPNLVERRNKKQVLVSKQSNEKDTPDKKEPTFKKKDSNKKPDGMKENTSLHERKGTASAKPKLIEASDENARKPVKSKAISRTTVERGGVAAKVENSPKKKPSFFTLLRSSSGRRSLEGKKEKNVNKPKKGSKTASTSSNDETREKVLHMIEPKPRKTPSKLGASKSAEEKDRLMPEKSTFRKGKVVELPPDPGTSKKLRFRKGRRSNENLAGFQIGKRSLRRKGSISSGSSNSHGQVVVLRHRETQEKKGIQGLFNSIIEETVNKLVKTRKSKVKALVGAFETVISLQDAKPVPVK